MQKFSTLLFLLLFTVIVNAQNGRISGMISDSKTGETLPGATILIEGSTRGASADFDGKFAINNVPPGKVNLIISYISYTTKKLEGVIVKPNDVVDINVLLDASSSQDLNEVEVVVTLNKENTTALILQQKNSASVSDGISAETIKRTPDRNTSDVLKRVSGASIQDNKFAIVRGLNERYNAAYLNGAPLPSSESDRKAFSFDIFPSNMLDNLVITKTARPDMPGEFAGGIIDISTKSIPEKNFVSVSAQGGYNTLTTFKDKAYYKGGKKDWLGLDDGTREMPLVIPSLDQFPSNRDKNAQAAIAKGLPEYDMNIYHKKFTPNMAFQASAGYNFKLKERDFFGIIAALTYNSTNSYTSAVRNTYLDNNPSLPSTLDAVFTDKGYTRQVLAGALLNLSCKISSNHSISSKNLYSINSDDRTILRSGTANLSTSEPGGTYSSAFWFTSNRIASSQLIGEHYFPRSKLRFNWVGGYSSVRRDVPNLRRNSYSESFGDSVYKAVLSPSSVGNDYGGNMFWSALRENIRSLRADLLRNFKVSENFNFDLKTGLYVQERARTFSARQFGFTFYETPPSGLGFNYDLLTMPLSQIFSNQNMGQTASGYGGFKLTEGSKPYDSYDASSSLKAGYLMADVKYKKWLRAVFGARMESYYQKIVVPDDFYLINKEKNTFDSTVVDVLPSLNLIFSLDDRQNIRASYSKTLNRPEFRELAPFAFYDFNTLFLTTGNLNLQRAIIDNYDLRYEIYPGRGQLFSASAFYKHFINPIEQVAQNNVNEIKYENAGPAQCYGMELEYRLLIGSFFKNDSSAMGKFLDNLTLFTNFAYIKSSVDISKQTSRPPDAPTTRPLQGQSPYLFNIGLTYANNDNGFSVSAIANKIGPRILVVGNFLTQPAIWETSRTALDLQVSKTFLKKRLEVRITARDVLAPFQYQYLYNQRDDKPGYDKHVDDLVRKVKFGATYALQLTYKF